MVLDIGQLCAPLGLSPLSLGHVSIRGLSTLEFAGETDLCFAERTDQADAVAASGAGAVLVPESFPELPGPLLIRVPEPRRSFFAIAELFVLPSEIEGIHPSAVIDPQASIGEAVAIGACAVIASGAHIGDHCVIGSGCFVGPHVSLGANCLIEANVTIHRNSTLGERCVVHSGTVIGGDGFGFAWDGLGHRKIPQLGRVVIEDDVDIGCNCCVDRATLGVTRIRRGARIDNLVQVAHNTDIGEHVILVSQAGVAGSSSIGSGAVIAGQVAISDHVKVGAGARVGGQSGVTKDVAPGAIVFGTPARPMKDTLRELAALAQLPALIKTIKAHEQELQTLRKQIDALGQPGAPGSIRLQPGPGAE